MSSKEKDLILIRQKDRLSKVLTDYKENLCTGKDLYDVLVEIQHSLENMITVPFDNEISKQDRGRFNASDGSSDSLIIHTRDDRTVDEYDFTDADVADIEILCAKHTLWLYEGSGEKVDLSGKKLLNIDFSNKDLFGIDTDGTDLYAAVTSNCSYNESEWLGEQENEEDQGMTMGGM